MKRCWCVCCRAPYGIDADASTGDMALFPCPPPPHAGPRSQYGTQYATWRAQAAMHGWGVVVTIRCVVPDVCREGYYVRPLDRRAEGTDVLQSGALDY